MDRWTRIDRSLGPKYPRSLQRFAFAPEERCLSQLYCQATLLNDDFQVNCCTFELDCLLSRLFVLEKVSPVIDISSVW